MKKLEVSKILVLTAMSLGLIACGPKSELSAENDQDSYSLKSSPVGEGGSQVAGPRIGDRKAPVIKNEGGSQLDEGGSQVTEEVDVTVKFDEGGSQLTDEKDDVSQISNPSNEGGSQLTEEKEFSNQINKIGSQIPEGGSQLAEVVDGVLLIRGTVTQKDLKAVYLMFNGEDPYEIAVRNMNFSANIELSERDLKGLVLQIVVEKVVRTFTFNEIEGLVEQKF